MATVTELSGTPVKSKKIKYLMGTKLLKNLASHIVHSAKSSIELKIADFTKWW